MFKNPFYIYSVYMDLPDYIADTIINDVCLDMDILNEKRVTSKNGKSYILVFVRYLRRYDVRFKRFLDILRYNMWLYNNDSYLADCKEVLLDEQHAEDFNRYWSK